MSEPSEHYSVSIGAEGSFGATLKVAPDETESGVAVVEHTLAPGTLGAPLHRHAIRGRDLVRAGGRADRETG